MGDSATVSYKVYLEDGSEAPEVRRFGIERINAFKFQYLREKLQSVFPSLQNKSFHVYWKDAEGDSVIISSDEELTIALSEMGTDVRKLYVVKNTSEFNYNSDFEMNDSFAKPGDGPPMHEGVTCDGCNKTVAGFRYKCIMCPDYDLCANCEGLGIHEDHFMIRIPKPVKWRPAFSRRLAHNMAKSARHGDPYRHHRRSSGGRYSTGQSQDENAGHCPYRGGQSWRGRHGNWLEYLCNQLGEWVNLPGEFEVPSGSQDQSSSDKTATSGNNESATAAASGAQPANKGAVPENLRDTDYLRKVGNTVAELLNPLGIDVEIRTKEDPPKKSEEGKKNVTFAEQGAVPREKQSPPRSATVEQMEVTPENPTAPPPERESPEPEGWTVLSQNHVTTSSNSVTTPVVGNQEAIAPHVAETSPLTAAFSRGPDLYPALEEMVERTRQLELQANSSIRDPKVAETLRQMLSMGFTNDGGWLTQLITIKNGDLESVLDVLQPVQK